MHTHGTPTGAQMTDVIGEPCMIGLDVDGEGVGFAVRNVYCVWLDAQKAITRLS